MRFLWACTGPLEVQGFCDIIRVDKLVNVKILALLIASRNRLEENMKPRHLIGYLKIFRFLLKTLVASMQNQSSKINLTIFLIGLFQTYPVIDNYFGHCSILDYFLFVFHVKSGTTNNDRTGLSDISYLSPYIVIRTT